MGFMRKFVYSYKYELLGAVLLLFGVLMNIFPEGYIFLGGDIIQPINMVENFSFYFHEWQGRVSLYYGIFYVLDFLGVSASFQLSWFLGIFLLASYVSFLCFSVMVFGRASSLIRSLVALFYSANIFTLSLFTASWGYTSYPIVYCFVPLLAGLYIRSIQSRRSYLVSMFILVSFFASSSFGNPAFALSLGLFFLVLTLMFVLTRYVRITKSIAFKIGLMFFGALAVNFFWILPMIPQVQSGVQEVSQSTDLNLTEALKKTSNKIYDSFRLMPSSEQSRYYPVNFPFKSIDWLEGLLVLFAFAPMFCALIYIRRLDIKSKDSQLYLSFLGTFLVFIVLVTRAGYPFEVLNAYVFQLPGLNTLRGYDKTAILLPFLIGSLVLISFLTLLRSRYSNIIFALFFLSVLTLAAPFFIGGIQTKLSYILYNQKGKSFLEAKQSALVRIPEEYLDAKSVFDEDKESYKLGMLPYSPGSSVGRVSLPEWKVNGPHFSRYMYQRSFLELTEKYFSGWKFADDFLNSEHDSRWIVDLYGLLNVGYVFYHKDAKEDRINKFEPVLERLVESGMLQPVQERSRFTLYAVNKKYFFPYIYANNLEDSSVSPNLDGLSRQIVSLRESMKFLQYSKLNPKRFEITVDEQFTGLQSIFLNEKKDSLWRARYISLSGESLQLEEDNRITYANAWTIPSHIQSGKIVISYLPAELFFPGLVVTLSALGMISIGCILGIRKYVIKRTI